jgi:hypothetical protein
MASKRYVLRSLRPLRLIATAVYLELSFRSSGDAIERAILIAGGLVMAWSTYSILRSDRNFREGRVVFEVDDDSIVVTPSAAWPRPRRLPHVAIASVSVRRRGENVSLQLRRRGGKSFQVRVDPATCDYILSRIPSDIPVRRVDVPTARAMKLPAST